MTTILAPVRNIQLNALQPYVLHPCVLEPPVPEPEPEVENEIFVPVPPGIEYASLPVVNPITEIIDTSPNQIIGCANELPNGSEQDILNILFPVAVTGDGVVNRENNDIWTYDGSLWSNVGPTPGPQVIVSSVIPPWNEIVTCIGRIRTKVFIGKADRSLSLLTEIDAYGITVGLVATSSSAFIEVPGVAFTLEAFAPIVSGGASVFTPITGATVTASQPLVSSGSSVAPPSADLIFSANEVPYVGTLATVIQPPGIQTSLQVLEPLVSGGASIATEVTNFALIANVPQVNDVAPTVPVVGTQGANTAAFSLALGTYLQNDILLLAIETGGEGTTLTPPSPWQAIPGSPVIDVGTIAGSKLQVWWSRASSNSTGTETVVIPDSGDHQVARIMVVRGCLQTGNPWDVIQTSSTAVSSFTSTAPAVDTNYGQTRVVSIISRPTDSGSLTNFDPPSNAVLSGLVDHGEAGTANGHGGGFLFFSGVKILPGNTGVSTVTQGISRTSAAMTIAFRPES